MLPGVHEILFMGDDDGVAETAHEWGFRHVGHIARDSDNVPLMDSLMTLANEAASHDVVCLINTDISLSPGVTF
jgi:hypothetical protein